MTRFRMGSPSAHTQSEFMLSLAARLARIGPPLAMLLGVALLLLASNAILSPSGQAYVSAGAFLCAFLMRKRSGHPTVLFLIGLSIFMSLRYILWRVFNTLAFHGWVSTILMLLLLGAEIYSWIILFLGYMQLAWPLNRKPFPLPKDRSTWPSVDVFIPTYNEDLFVVRNTVLAAMALDWPADRLKIHLLDDGRRPEFAAFAREAGAGYITRPDNRHAKAGNLNHALKQTSGDLVAIFDCDHVPVKSFLTRTAGWMVFNPRIALLQTPHYFYSLDPFQRNLEMSDRTPPENNLFYGLVQPGNDFWDSTIFCGSCALLRRAALEEIHGFAIETVTEDAHTSLKLQRKGWETAYLREALAGGLATERLALHVSQRIRWARGMVQIFRLDNPLLGRGLRLGQRLCYFSAILHFFFAIPRLIFLLAPLAFLFLGQNIIYASPVAVFTYAMPHLMHALITQSRIQGRWRHSMWNYVYETSIAAFLVPIVLVALIQPRRGVFNVTAKGGLVERNYLDTRIVRPNVIIALTLMAALAVGTRGMLTHHYTTTLFQTYAMNLIWVLGNLLVVMAAITVGYERKQVRRAPRITASLAVTLSSVSADGHAQHFTAETIDLSAGGLSLRMATPLPPDIRMVTVDYVNRADDIRVKIPAAVIRQDNHLLRLEWRGRDLADERAIVEMIFCRSDAWSEWGNYLPDRPLHNLELLARHTVQFLFLMVSRGSSAAGRLLSSAIRRRNRLEQREAPGSLLQGEYAAPAKLPADPVAGSGPGPTPPPKSA